MWKFLLRVLILSIIILILAHILPGLDVPNFPDALLFAFIVALMNAFIAPLLIVVSYPITVMTVGIFALLINVLLFWVASLVSYGVHITSFWGAFWGGMVVAFSSLFLNAWLSSLPPKGKNKPRD